MKAQTILDRKNSKAFNKVKNLIPIPPLTSPLVQMALIERVVMTQTTAEMSMMTRESPMPACETTHEMRRNSITPQMFSRHGIKTPYEQKFSPS